MTVEASPYRLLLGTRLLKGEHALAQVRFEAGVLQKYRESGFKIYRTDSAGKLQQPGGWYIDFGIVPGDAVIHTSLTNLGKLPESERAHWQQHIAWPDLNDRFLKMQLAGGQCEYDGEIRNW